MKETKAAGPKTELVGVSVRMQQSIEDMIASFSKGIADCVRNADSAEPESAYDDRRSNERRDATQLMTATAELLGSIAKLKGEFSHNYHIIREEAAKEKARRDRAIRESKLRPEEEVDAMGDDEYIDYIRDLDGLPPKHAPAGRRRDMDPRVDQEVAALHEEAKRVEAMLTTPPPENRGSNEDAGES